LFGSKLANNRSVFLQTVNLQQEGEIKRRDIHKMWR
jgi:hypothetical protein